MRNSAILICAGILAASTVIVAQSVADTVTPAFFDGIVNQADAGCAGKGFYSRNAFLQAVNLYPSFGAGNQDVSKREIAAFFAHVTFEIGPFCFIEARDRSNVNCDRSDPRFPCAPGKSYYGRGPLQISWNYNYGPAGQNIGFDGMNAPETVATDPVVSFRTAFWFWMNYVHSNITSGQGFGGTIRAINVNECDGGDPASVNVRVQNYRNFCNQFSVSPGNNLTC